MPYTARTQAAVLACAAVILVAGISYYMISQFPATPGRCSARDTFGVNVTMTFYNRTYCGEKVGVENQPLVAVGNSGIVYHGPTTYSTFLGFGFLVTPWYDVGVTWLNTTITEPNGAIHHGGPYWTGVVGDYSNTWFTPDNESGVYATMPSENAPVAAVVVLVEVGA